MRNQAPVIYTALEFYRLPNGNLTHHTHYIAACSQAQAIEALHDAGPIDYGDCWITTEQTREAPCPSVLTRAQLMRSDVVDPAEYERWKDVASPETWSRVRAPRKSLGVKVPA